MDMGMREIIILNEYLRYSLLPSKKMLLSRINKDNDIMRKCIIESGIKETSYWNVCIITSS